MNGKKVNAQTYTGILLRKPRAGSPKVTYLDVKTDVVGRTLQWVVFNANFDTSTLKRIKSADANATLTILGTTNVNAKTGQDQIVVQKVLNIADANADAEDVVVRSNNDVLELVESLELLRDDDAESISKTWNQLYALVEKLPKQLAIGMLAKCIAAVNGEYHAR